MLSDESSKTYALISDTKRGFLVLALWLIKTSKIEKKNLPGKTFCRICHYVALSWNTCRPISGYRLSIYSQRYNNRKEKCSSFPVSILDHFIHIVKCKCPTFLRTKKKEKRLTPNHKFGNGGILSIGHGPAWFKVWASRSKYFP